MKIGFIGAGNMAKAMLGGILANGIFNKEEIIASDASEACLKAIEDSLGISTTTDNKIVAYSVEIPKDLPNLITPHINIGMFIKIIINPIGIAKKWLIIVAIPDTPPAIISFEAKKQLSEKPASKHPIVIIKYFFNTATDFFNKSPTLF